MSRSKATVALMRLKEMDRKYNIKHKESKQIQSNVSTESSLEDYPIVLQSTSRNSTDRNNPQVLPKVVVEVPTPTKHPNGDEYPTADSKTSSKTKSISEAEESGSDASGGNVIVKLKTSPESVSSLEENVQISKHETFNSSKNDIDSSISVILSKESEIFEVISEPIKSTQIKTVAEDSIPLSNMDSDDTLIEEAIRIPEDKSETISEKSFPVANDTSIVNISFKDEHKTQYEEDTFEDASTSSASTNTTIEKLHKTSVGNTMISGIKHIKITPHKQTEVVQKIVIDENRDKEIVELVPPKLLQSTSECDIGLDEELSNYVKITENVDEVVPISLLKLCKQIPRKHTKRGRRHRRSSNENTEANSVTSDYEKLRERKENNMAEVPAEKVSSTSRKSEQNDSQCRSESNKEETLRETENEITNIEGENLETTSILSEEKILREIPKKSDATTTLRNLNKDAINAITRRHRLPITGDVVTKRKDGRNIETVVKLPVEVSENVESRDRDASSFENSKTNDQRCKEKKMRIKKCARGSKNRKTTNYSTVEGKYSRCEQKHIHHLRKYAATLRLQQEREDIRNYLLELEHTRLEFGPGASIESSQLPPFKPLDFPKIATFLKSDSDESKLRDKNEIAGLQEKVAMIKQWLKDQYILYRDYSNLASTVNKKYIPASLEDAKRTIRQLQKATIKSR